MKKLVITLFLLSLISAYAQDISQADVQRFSAYYSNGMGYLQNGQYSSAISEFRKVLRFSPYDTMLREALINSYAARAQYYRQTTKEIKKAVNDDKSAVFYARYWSKEAPKGSIAQIANSAQHEINDLEKRIGVVVDSASRLQNAKNLRAQGELAAAGYDFHQLLNTSYAQEAYENLGNIYKNLNNLSQAMDYMKTALDNNPKNAKLHFLYGVMLDEAKNYDASMEQYNLALQYGDKSPELMEILENKWTQNIVNNPTDAQGYINLGAIYQKQGNLESAKTQYLKAISMNPDDETSYLNLASLYIQQKNYAGAIDTYNKLLAKKPNNIQFMEYKASALYNAGRFDEALGQNEAILALNPNNDKAKAAKDDIILNHFTGDKLLKYFATTAQSKPKSYEAQFNYALELHKAKRYQEALKYYQKALNINPSKEETYINIAQIYLDQKNYKAASDICQRGLIMLPDSKMINQYLQDSKNLALGAKYDSATKLYEQRQFEAALKAYLAMDEKTTEVNMAIASCYAQMNDYEKANIYYNTILASDPNNMDALVNSAYAYFTLKDYTNAKTTAQKILALDKNNKEAQNIINSIEDSQNTAMLNEAISLYEESDFGASVNLLNKYLNKNPKDVYALYYRALNYDEMKKKNDAMKNYKYIISLDPNFENAYYSLALDYDNSENYKEAVENYEKFISVSKSKNQDNDSTKFAVSRVKELKEYLEKLDKSNGDKK